MSESSGSSPSVEVSDTVGASNSEARGDGLSEPLSTSSSSMFGAWIRSDATSLNISKRLHDSFEVPPFPPLSIGLRDEAPSPLGNRVKNASSNLFA